MRYAYTLLLRTLCVVIRRNIKILFKKIRIFKFYCQLKNWFLYIIAPKRKKFIIIINNPKANKTINKQEITKSICT